MKQNSTLKKIKSILTLVQTSKYSKFYRKKYGKIPSMKTWEDFEKLPFLTKQELVGTSPFDRLYVPENKVYAITISSGTTGGTQPFVSFKSRYGKDTINNYKKFFKELKIKRNLALFPSPNRAIGFSKITGIDFPTTIIGDVRELQKTAFITSEARVDSIQTTSTILLKFLPVLEKVYNLDKLKFVDLGGEFSTKEEYKLIKAKLPKCIIRFGYGSAEAPESARGCDTLLIAGGPQFQHPSPMYFIEIVDSESGKILGFGKEGEIVVTSLYVIPTPMIRYKTGDLGIMTHKKCRCGKEYILEVKGRSNFDSLRFQGVVLDAQRIQDAVISASNFIESDFSLHVYEKRFKKEVIKTQLIIEVIPKKEKVKSSNFDTTVASIISRNLYITQNLTLADYVQKELFLPLVIKKVKEFPLGPKKKYILSHLT